MVQRKPPAARPRKKLVWRISESAPLGEFVDPDLPSTPGKPANVPEISTGGWVVSSFELLHGADVSEGPDTVPDDLFDQLFPPAPSSAKPSSGD